MSPAPPSCPSDPSAANPSAPNAVVSDPIVSDRLVPLGWDARHAAAFDDVAAPAHRHGTNSDSVPARVTRVTRVTRVDRGACDLVGAEGASRAYNRARAAAAGGGRPGRGRVRR